MNGQPSSPQAVVYNISNTNGNNYVNATPSEAARAECPTGHADSQTQARAPPSPPLDDQHNVTRFTDTSHVNLNNRTGFDQGNVARTLDGAQSPNKETIDSILDGDNHSTNETPTNKDAATETNATYQPPSSAQFRITVQTNEEGVVVLDGKLVPYTKSGLNVAHAKQYWSYYAHILPGNNRGLFPALTEDNIQDFIDRLNLIRQEVLSIGKATFEAEIVSAFNRSGHTTNGQPISCTKHVEELMRTWEGNVLSCLRLTWLNIHSLNTENSVFLKETLPVALVVHGATHDPPYTISNEASCKVFGKKRVSNHGLVKLANSACVDVKKRFQELEEKLFGMSVRTKARSKHSVSAKHYEIEINLGSKANMRCKSYILARKTLFKGQHFSDDNPPTEKDLREYFNSGDEVRNLLQAAVSRAKRAGITREVLLSSMDDCYQEVTSFSNIALPPDLDDILDLDDSMEGESSTIDSCLQGRKREQQFIEEHWQMAQKEQTWESSQTRKTQHVQEHLRTQQHHPTEMVHNDLVKWKELYKQNQQPSQIERMESHHLGASMEGGSSTIDSGLQERMTEPRSIEQLLQMVHSLQARQNSHTGNPRQVHDHGCTQQQQLQEIAENDREQRSLQLHQHNQQHPQMELTEIHQQIQQPNPQTQLMEQMLERVRLLEAQVRKETTQQEEQQRQQKVMGQGTSGDHLLEQSVQLDEHMEQQQRSQIPMGPVALLDFFEPSSRRLPPSLEQTTVDDYEEDESTSIQSQEEESNQMQQQHPVETILHSKFESSGQQKYLIRWMGDYKDSWQPKGNITSDIIEDFDKRKMQEMANKHLAEV